MSRFIDLTGQRFGRLTVESLNFKTHTDLRGVIRKTSWVCVCDCGSRSKVDAGNLRNGNTKSCGCLGAENLLEANTTHGMTWTPTWQSWVSMRRRCTDPTSNRYEHYKNRGIHMDPRWENLDNFYADMGERPSLAHSIERIDNDGPYFAWNCIWATDEDQANNRSSNRLVAFMGIDKTLMQWCRQLCIPYGTAMARLNYDWTVEQAFCIPMDGKKHSRDEPYSLPIAP